METLAPEKNSNGSALGADSKESPRDRILAAAHDLFYKHGLHVVSVDQIAEAASSNKMTLYRHFKSKDELIAACARECAREWEDEWKQNVAEHPGDPLGALRAWCRGAAECMTSEERGCFMANAAVELPQTDHPARRVIESSKRAHRDALISLAREAGFAEPEQLGDALFMTMEGARICTQSVCQAHAADRLYAMLDALIISHKRK
ncbi:MAG: TetR/AcrR family transcriptional regulator [Rhodospirillaceae bacterium]